MSSAKLALIAYLAIFSLRKRILFFRSIIRRLLFPEREKWPPWFLTLEVLSRESHLSVRNVAPSGRNELAISIAFRFSRDTRLIVRTMANAICVKERDGDGTRHAARVTLTLLGTSRLQPTRLLPVLRHARRRTRVGRKSRERKLRCYEQDAFYLCAYFTRNVRHFEWVYFGLDESGECEWIATRRSTIGFPLIANANREFRVGNRVLPWLSQLQTRDSETFIVANHRRRNRPELTTHHLPIRAGLHSTDADSTMRPVTCRLSRGQIFLIFNTLQQFHDQILLLALIVLILDRSLREPTQQERIDRFRSKWEIFFPSNKKMKEIKIIVEIEDLTEKAFR